MPRTTVDIEAPILKEIKRLQREEGLPMGKIVSRLLAEALSQHEPPRKASRFVWRSRAMNPLVDLSDKEALYAALDRHERDDG